MAIDKQILETLKTKLETLSWVKKVEFDQIKIISSEIKDHEIPLIQFYDGGQSIQHNAKGGILTVNWAIHIELILKQSAAGAVSKSTLLDNRQEIEQLIGANCDLGIPGMIHFKYVGNFTDLHSIAPFYYSRLDFEAIYHKKVHSIIT